jgi:hypothetical protein
MYYITPFQLGQYLPYLSTLLIESQIIIYWISIKILTHIGHTWYIRFRVAKQEWNIYEKHT